jgi:uncharacterized membrane protein
LLVYEFALVAFGIELLAVVPVTVIKDFVWDMAELSGLYRAASFLGLGLSRVAIGWLYQRFVGIPPGNRDGAPDRTGA